MSDKKRTTVTTIDTHEVWIVRKRSEPMQETESELAIPTSAEESTTPNQETDKNERGKR